jgi:Rrf2 family protein
MIRLTQRTRYAILAVVEIAQGDGKPVRNRVIAKRHGFSRPFLAQALIELKRAGLIESHRGCEGGFTLARPPSEISLADIIAIHEDSQPIAFESSSRRVSAGIESVLNDTMGDLWRRLEAVRVSMLQDAKAKP